MNELVYPRLPLSVALQRVEEVREQHAAGGWRSLRELAAASHPAAAPVPTGGRIASVQQIWFCRSQVLDRMAAWMQDDRLAPADQVRFDVALGQALHESLRILPADAAHNETWYFLSLVVFPEIVALRFPGLHADRLLGRPRNALRRVWVRQDTLGSLLDGAEWPLGEDESVGIFERTALMRNRRLAKVLAVEVMRRPPTGNRSKWARELYKRVTYATGPRLLDVLTDTELAEFVRHQADETSRVLGAAARLSGDETE